MEQDDYRLSTPPRSYDRLRDSLLVAMATTALSTVVGILLLRMRNVPLWLSLGTVTALLVSLAWMGYVLRALKKEFPNWRTYHERVLSPILPTQTLQNELRIPLAAIPRHRLERSLLLAMTCLTTLGLFAVGLKPLAGVVLCVWMISVFGFMTYRRHALLSNQNPVLIADNEKIILPNEILLPYGSRKLRRWGLLNKEISWREILEWTVDSGGSDSPDTHRILLRDKTEFIIYRRLLGIRERDVLEYVRSHGISVRLKDSVASSKSGE